MFLFLAKVLWLRLIAHLWECGIETPPLELLVDYAVVLVDFASAEPSPEGC